MDHASLVTLTADIVAAHVANNRVPPSDMPTLVQQVHGALAALAQPDQTQEVEQKKSPVVSIRASVKPEYLICMECGRRQKTLRRHIMSAHGLTPAQYRSDYGLPDSYPLTAPVYSEHRRQMAKSIGLGRKKAAPAEGAPAKPPARRKAAAARGGRKQKGA